MSGKISNTKDSLAENPLGIDVGLYKKAIRTFSRKSSKGLKDGEKQAFEHYQDIIYKSPQEVSLIMKDLANHGRRLILEIGFGDGGHLIHKARLCAKDNATIIGSEVYVNGIASMLGKAFTDANECDIKQNVIILQNDALELLKALPDNILSEVFILFPDPWPKTKHRKRRLVNRDNIILLQRKLAPKGKLRIMTDHDDYFLWILNEFSSYYNSTSQSEQDNTPQEKLVAMRGAFPYPIFLYDENTDKSLKANLSLNNRKDITKYINIEDFLGQPINHIITKYQNIAIKAGRQAKTLEFVKC